MGTERRLSAIIQDRTAKTADARTPPLGYTEQKIMYAPGRVIRVSRVVLWNLEPPDVIKIALEALTGQQVLLFRLATLSQPNDPDNYVDLPEQTGSAADADIAKLSLVVPPRNGYKWHLFLGDYPDSAKRFFRTRIELTQMPNVASETLRFRVTFQPNIWSSGNHFGLETDPFVPHS